MKSLARKPIVAYSIVLLVLHLGALRGMSSHAGVIAPSNVTSEPTSPDAIGLSSILDEDAESHVLGSLAFLTFIVKYKVVIAGLGGLWGLWQAERAINKPALTTASATLTTNPVVTISPIDGGNQAMFTHTLALNSTVNSTANSSVTSGGIGVYLDGTWYRNDAASAIGSIDWPAPDTEVTDAGDDIYARSYVQYNPCVPSSPSQSDIDSETTECVVTCRMYTYDNATPVNTQCKDFKGTVKWKP